MKHLTILSRINLLFGGVMAVLGAATFFVFLAPGLLMGLTMHRAGSNLTHEPMMRSTLFTEWFQGMGITAAGVAFTVAVMASISFVLLAALHLALAVQLKRGRARWLQAVAIVLHVFSLPIGTAYAVYAFYVCWLDRESASLFVNPHAQPKLDGAT